MNSEYCEAEFVMLLVGLGVGLHDVLYQPLVRLTRPPSEADQRLGAPGQNITVK